MLFSLLLSKIIDKDIVVLGRPFLLQSLLEEVFVVYPELLQFHLVEPLVLELALKDVADTRTVQVLAGERREIVRETTVVLSMTIACQCKLAKLVFFATSSGSFLCGSCVAVVHLLDLCLLSFLMLPL